MVQPCLGAATQGLLMRPVTGQEEEEEVKSPSRRGDEVLQPLSLGDRAYRRTCFVMVTLPIHRYGIHPLAFSLLTASHSIYIYTFSSTFPST